MSYPLSGPTTRPAGDAGAPQGSGRPAARPRLARYWQSWSVKLLGLALIQAQKLFVRAAVTRGAQLPP